MYKIVINETHRGLFELSGEAILWLEKNGSIETKYLIRQARNGSVGGMISPEMAAYVSEKIMEQIPRHNKDLVNVVESLKEKAGNGNVCLSVKTIDQNSYKIIKEDDGFEILLSRNQLEEITTIEKEDTEQIECTLSKDARKEILLKDILPRLKNGIIVSDELDPFSVYNLDYHPNIKECIPFLRPLSSMTRHEQDVLETKFKTYLSEDGDTLYTRLISPTSSIYYDEFFKLIDWLIERRFDFRGLIKLGIARKAPNGMYI